MRLPIQILVSKEYDINVRKQETSLQLYNLLTTATTSNASQLQSLVPEFNTHIEISMHWGTVFGSIFAALSLVWRKCFSWVVFRDFEVSFLIWIVVKSWNF